YTALGRIHGGFSLLHRFRPRDSPKYFPSPAARRAPETSPTAHFTGAAAFARADISDSPITPRRPSHYRSPTAAPYRAWCSPLTNKGRTAMADTVNSLRELLVEELQDLYDAEQRLLKALPQMAAK